jgi:hypothetical protein
MYFSQRTWPNRGTRSLSGTQHTHVKPREQEKKMNNKKQHMGHNEMKEGERSAQRVARHHRLDSDNVLACEHSLY